MPKKIPKTKPTSKRSPKVAKLVTTYEKHECWLIPFQVSMIVIGLLLFAMGGILNTLIPAAALFGSILEVIGLAIAIMFSVELLVERHIIYVQ